MSDEAIKITSKPVDITDWLSGETIITRQFKGVECKFHFRELDTKTDLQYQKRLRNSDGKSNDEALDADIWLFDRLCSDFRVVISQSEDGQSPTSESVPDFKTRLAPDVKRAALFDYRRVRLTSEAEGN